jgi:hypothetical protein
VRQLAAAAGDGSLGFAGSPGQLETSLNSGYTVGPCNSYLEGPTLFFLSGCSRIAPWTCLVRRRSRRKERLRSLLLTTAGGAIPTLAADPLSNGGARSADARSPRPVRLQPGSRSAHARSPRGTSCLGRLLAHTTLAADFWQQRAAAIADTDSHVVGPLRPRPLASLDAAPLCRNLG